MTGKGALLLLAGALPLGGCAASLAASAVGLAVQAAQGTPQNNVHLGGAAAEACRARAAQHGEAQIIDVEHRSASKIIVWGTVDDGKARQSFECGYTTKITGFTLRPIAPRR
ncbi:MAG TPA: hypothetical protein VF727_04925 [Allosphingosinicella sp.]|jgi:hypothetical protein